MVIISSVGINFDSKAINMRWIARKRALSASTFSDGSEADPCDPSGVDPDLCIWCESSRFRAGKQYKRWFEKLELALTLMQGMADECRLRCLLGCDGLKSPNIRSNALIVDLTNHLFYVSFKCAKCLSNKLFFTSIQCFQNEIFNANIGTIAATVNAISNLLSVSSECLVIAFTP